MSRGGSLLSERCQKYDLQDPRGPLWDFPEEEASYRRPIEHDVTSKLEAVSSDADVSIMIARVADTTGRGRGTVTSVGLCICRLITAVRCQLCPDGGYRLSALLETDGTRTRQARQTCLSQKWARLSE